MSVQRALVASGLFNKAGMDAAAAKFASELTPVHLPRGSLIYTQNDPSGDLYLIITGKVKACTRLSTDEELILKVFGHAEFFGFVSAFDLQRRESTAIALTDVCLLPIHQELITSWLAKDPQIGLQLLRILARRTRRLTTLRYEAPAVDASRLVAKRLVELAQSFGAREGEAVRVTHEMTIDELAQFAGGRLRVVALALEAFSRRGWIVVGESSLLIQDMEQLNEFATTMISPTNRV